MSKTKSDISKSIMEVKDALTAEKNNKLERLRRITDNPEILSKIDSIALSQEDLYDILENAAQDGREMLTVYLLGRRFAVPYNVGNVKYIGLELYIGLEPGEFSRPVLALSAAEKSISLKEKGIAVENCALLAATRDKLSASEREELEKELQSRAGAEEARRADDIKKEKDERYRIGNMVHFGDFDWMVLNKSADTALLITKDAVEQRAFHQDKNSTDSWAQCSLRKYLNGEFLEAHFSVRDRSRIQEAHLDDAGCNDKIFLLSVNEASYLFLSEQARISKYQNEACWWWLRSPGYNSGFTAAGVNNDGGIYASGSHVKNASGCVRPALYLKF